MQIWSVSILTLRSFTYVPTIFFLVYLQTDPEIAYQRAVSRGRPEEATLQKEFLYGIHRLHEDWLIHGNTTTHAKVPSPV